MNLCISDGCLTISNCCSLFFKIWKLKWPSLMTETVTDKLPWFPFMGLSGWDHFYSYLNFSRWRVLYIEHLIEKFSSSNISIFPLLIHLKGFCSPHFSFIISLPKTPEVKDISWVNVFFISWIRDPPTKFFDF